MINDAAMQALGSYEGGRMLFLGLGTGLGSTMIADGHLEPMELGHLPYKRATFEDYVGRSGLKRMGKKKWRRNVERVVERLTAALLPDYVVLGGGNAKKLKTLPPLCRPGDNANAFAGGYRLWEESGGTVPDAPAPPPARAERKAGRAGRDGAGGLSDGSRRDTGHRAAGVEGPGRSPREGSRPPPARPLRRGPGSGPSG